MLDRMLHAVGDFGYRRRYFVLAFALLLFIAVAVTQNFARISYTDDSQYNKLTDVFPEDTLVIIYDNADEEKMGALAAALSEDEHVLSVQAYATTVGREMTTTELAETFDTQEYYVQTLFYIKETGKFKVRPYGYDTTGKTMSLYDCILFANDVILPSKQFSPYIDEEARAQLNQAKEMVLEGKTQLVGEKHSRMIVTHRYTPETKEIHDFYASLEKELNANCTGDHYLVGNTAMSYELSKTFKKEYLLIMLLTALAVFLIVCLAFRKLAIPLILVCIIECAVFITLSGMVIGNASMYFIALIIIQCVLMGAMVDYGILFSNYYIEVRREYSIKDALPEVLKRSIRSIAVSATILIAITLVCGFIMTGAVAAILKTLCIGAVSALLLVLFVLPPLLAVFDKFIIKEK